MNIVLLTPGAAEPICDFCSSPEIYTTHCCMPHDMQKSEHFRMTDGDGLWAACKECDALIQKEDWSALLERSVTTFFEMYGQIVTREQVRSHIAMLHQQFRDTRRREA